MGEHQSNGGTPAIFRVHNQISGRVGGSTLQVGSAAQVNHVGRDQHLHYGHGVRGQRRVVVGHALRECPYPGLAGFDRDHARWFFGRDRLVAELTGLVDQRLRFGGMQFVIAPSGAGKSSLLRAGLLPMLEHGALPGSDRWPKLVCTPTARPVGMLTAALAPVLGVDAHWVRHAFTAGPSGFPGVPAREPRRGERVVVVVDQFEEVFTLCSDDQERRTFIGLLDRLATGAPLTPAPALVIVGMRADFYPVCVDHPPLRKALQHGPLVVGPMSDAELREAILYPAQDVGLEVEDGFTELVLRDLGMATTCGAEHTGGEAGRLPLLAHALRSCWQQRHGSTMTVSGYVKTGGIQHAVATTAELTYTRLGTDGQRIAQSLFLRMTKIGDGTDDTRRRLTRVGLFETGADPAAVTAVADAFTQARLLTQHHDSIEITHDALLHSWPRLRHWIDANRADRLVRQHLEETAASWSQGNHDPSLLYRGSRLESAAAWAATAPFEDLSRTGRAFLAASARARRRTNRRRAAVMAVLAVLSLLTSITAVIANHQRQRAVHQRDIAIAGRVIGEVDRTQSSDISLAAQLGIAAHRIDPTNTDVRTRLIALGNSPLAGKLTAHDEVRAVAFSPDGSILATGGDDRTLRLWDASDPGGATPLGKRVIDGAAVSSLAFSPDGAVLAIGGTDGTTRLWDVSNTARPTPVGALLVSPGREIRSAAFSRSGNTFATSSSDGTTRLWDMSDPSHVKPLGRLSSTGSTVSSIAFSPTRAVLATGGSDGSIRFWDLSQPRQPLPTGLPMTGHVEVVTSVAFSPDGRTVATGSNDRTVRLWDVSNPTSPVLLSAPMTGRARMGAILSVRFSPDGRILATGSSDHTARLWNVSNLTDPTELGQPLTGHTAAVTSVSFSSDNRTLATGSADGTARLWTIPQSVLSGHTADIWAVAFSPTRPLLAAASADGTVHLWDTTDPDSPDHLDRALTGHRSGIWAVAFSPDGRLLATGSNDRTVRLWDVADPGRPRSVGQPLTGPRADAWAVAFSRDGRSLVVGSLDGTLRLWDVADPERPRLTTMLMSDVVGGVISVAFSPDDRTLAVGAGDGTIHLLDMTDPRSPTGQAEPLSDHENRVESLMFSPDGDTLASGGEDGTVRLWNVTDPHRPEALSHVLTGHSGIVVSVAFSPDGHTLATGGRDNTVRLWDVSIPSRAKPVGHALTGHTDAVYSVTFGPDGNTLATGSFDRTVRLWTLNTEENIDHICAATGQALGAPEWNHYVSTDIPYSPPC